MKKEVKAIHIAPASIRLAWCSIAGIAMLPTAEKPVKNFAPFIHLIKKNKNKGDFLLLENL